MTLLAGNDPGTELASLTEGESEERYYSADSRIRKPRLLLREMLHDAWGARDLARQLVVRELRSRHHASALGIFWTLGPTLGMTLVFSLADASSVIRFGQTDLPYPVYVLLSLVLWQAFLDGLQEPVQTLFTERSLLAREQVPSESIILAGLGIAACNLGIRLVPVAAAFLVYRIPVGVGALSAAVPALLLTVLGAGFGLFLAPLNALYRDVSSAVSTTIPFFFLLTPVVFPVPTRGLFRFVVTLNPVTPLLVTARELLTGRPVTLLLASVVVGLLALLLAGLAWVFFRLATPIVIERANA